jgi:hypothetical protein
VLCLTRCHLCLIHCVSFSVPHPLCLNLCVSSTVSHSLCLIHCVSFSVPRLFQPRSLCALTPQAKPSRMKLVAFTSGLTRHTNWFLHLGDHLTLCCSALYKEGVHPPSLSQRRMLATGGGNWLFNDLQLTTSPGTKLGSYVKNIQDGGQQKYAEFAIKRAGPLPEGSKMLVPTHNHLVVIVCSEILVRRFALKCLLALQRLHFEQVPSSRS